MGSIGGWNPAMSPPDWVTAEAAAEALGTARLRAMPAGTEAFAIAMDRLLEFAFAFGVKVPDRAALVTIYRDALRLPSDLLDLAVTRAIGSWTWGNRLPMPGELRQLVGADILERERDLVTANALAGKFVLPDNRRPQSFRRPLKDAPTPITDEFYRAYPHLRGKLLKYWPKKEQIAFIEMCTQKYPEAKAKEQAA